ncbi:MAG: TonB-dependent receptor, partial [Bacteroidales bacterium]|nr:TonB-dependent receptor [Bacteroidales bacterium]
TPYGSVLLFNASVEYAFRYATLFVEAYNVTDRHYRDLGGVPQPGATILAGIRMNR